MASLRELLSDSKPMEIAALVIVIFTMTLVLGIGVAMIFGWVPPLAGW